MNILQNMRMFARVVESGSFTAAAQSVNASTGAMSRAVSELEKHLRARLLNRSTRRFALTPTGQKYFRDCQKILADIDRAEEEASGAHKHPTGTLRMFSFASIGQHYVLPAIAKYRAQYPEVVVELTLSQSMPDFFAGVSDVAVVAAPSLPDSELISHLLGSTFSILCTSPEYASSRGTPKNPADLIHHECLTLNTPAVPTNEWLLEGAYGSKLIQVRSLLQVNVAESLVVAIREGMGIGMLPLHAAVEGLRDGTLIRVLPDYTLLNLNIYALYPSRQFVDAKTRTWVDFLRLHVPETIARDRATLACCPAQDKSDHVPSPSRQATAQLA